MSFLITLFTTLLTLTQINAIQFNLSTPTQCDPLTVDWTGKQGNGDMYLLIMPARYANQALIRNYTIPGSASSPYTLPGLANPAGLEFVATLVDESGFEGTGVSDVLTIGSSQNGNSSCLPAVSPDPDFFFYTDPPNPISVSQCGNVRITWQNSYTLPTSIVGLIPGGEIFTIHDVTGPDQGGGAGQPGAGYDWKVNTRSGNGVILYMSDSGPIGTGGSTELFTVGESSDSSCLSEDSPTTISPATTVSGVGGGGGRPTSGPGSETGSAGNSSSGGSTNTGAIIGGAVGGAACLVLLAILLFIFLRRRARQVNDPHHPRNKLVGSYGTAGPGAIGAKEDDAEKARRRSSVVDLLSGDKTGRTGAAGAGATAAVVPPMGRQDSDETETYEPSPYFSGVPTTFNGFSPDPSSPTQASRQRQSGDTERNRLSSANMTNNGMIGDLDFGSNSGLGMAGYGRRPSDTEASTQSGFRTDQAALSHSGATIAPRPRVESTPDDPSTNSSPMGTAGRSNSTRKARPAVGASGGGSNLPSAPTRFVLHTDAGGMEAEPQGPDENGVVDIPPTYDSLGNSNTRS